MSFVTIKTAYLPWCAAVDIHDMEPYYRTQYVKAAIKERNSCVHHLKVVENPDIKIDFENGEINADVVEIAFADVKKRFGWVLEDPGLKSEFHMMYDIQRKN